MKLTTSIAQSITNIKEDGYVEHEGIRDMFFAKVGATFDRPSNTFPLRPSSCLKPLRDLYYDLLNWETPGAVPKEAIEPRVKLIFEFGHATETILKTLCANTFKVSFEQHRVCYGTLKAKDGSVIRLEGSIDWAAHLNGELVLFDAKSSGSYPFKTAPKEDNIAQMQLYMHSDWGRANKVDRAILVYFNKDNSDIRCVEIKYDPLLAARILARLKTAWAYFKRRKLPPREYLAGIDWRADYSSYRDYDNVEFQVPAEERESVKLTAGAPIYKYKRDGIQTHINLFGNKVAKYSDKMHYVSYTKVEVKKGKWAKQLTLEVVDDS